jgi:hypothetical protein
MIDFPASPTLGQQFTDPTAGVTWTWDGTKWTAQGLSVAYLPLTGGTLSGNLTVAPATGIGSISIAPVASTVSLVLNRSANNFNSIIDFQSAGSPRWRLYLPTNEAETGGNAGSNFNLSSFGDNNAALPTNLVINRASGAATFGGNITAPGISAPQAIGDNRIINGDMRIDQRGVATGGGGTVAGYTLDRWYYGSGQTGKGTWSRQASGSPGPPFPYCLGFVSSSAYTPLATDTFAFWQSIEADMVSDFQWGTAQAQPVTLSFWVMSSKTGAFSGAISNYVSTRCYPFSYSIPVANAWTKIVVTVPGDTGGTWVMSGNGGSVYVDFDLGCGATYRGPAGAWATTSGTVYYAGVTGAQSIVNTNGANWYLTGVKLEVGSVATPYNRQSMAKSMIDCQRYYCNGQINIVSYGSAGLTVSFTYSLKATMRATPTLVVTPITAANCSNFGLASPSLPIAGQEVGITATVSALGGFQAQASFTASAEL